MLTERCHEIVALRSGEIPEEPGFVTESKGTFSSSLCLVLYPFFHLRVHAKDLSD